MYSKMPTEFFFRLLMANYNMVSLIYPSELQRNKTVIPLIPSRVFRLDLFIYNGIVSTKIYYKRDNFDFEIVNFPFLDGDVPRSTSYWVYISQLIPFARASSHVSDFNTHNKLLTRKLLKQLYWYHSLRKTFLNSIANTINWYLNSLLGLKLSCTNDLRNLSYMVT